MEKVLFVALGGGIGAALRYLLTELANLHGGVFFPYGTILANLIGSFCIGILFVFFSESSDLSPIVKLFFVTGILGGFTTFSTYNMELLTFVRTGAVFPAWPTSRSTSSAASSAAGLASPPATPCGDERRAARAARRSQVASLPS
ncbi:fluoride efflux transporter CrcB [Megasphaera sp. NM10]|uniref:fluoride efflux transporter CrcB n=1 Tax=Megasphaera sp. NM10 TaxID=1273103 RepID=UPI0003577282|nr:fluoride efflux transporter CrcB [Megasphaera sp. NM10]EPP18753.1 hypothetical protein NM10_02100 [Megasphaera sp. NM10]